MPKGSFEKQVASMPLEHLLCRVYGHKWDPATLEVEFGDFQIGLACSRCGTERDRFTHPDGEFIRSRFWYGDPDYLFVGLGRLTKEQRNYIARIVQTELRMTLPKPEKKDES